MYIIIWESFLNPGKPEIIEKTEKKIAASYTSNPSYAHASSLALPHPSELSIIGMAINITGTQ